MSRPARVESTPEQLETAILQGPRLDPCRWVYAKEVWDDDELDHWAKRVPPHAVIHALRRDLTVYGELLDEARAENEQLRAAVDGLVDAARAVVDLSGRPA